MCWPIRHHRKAERVERPCGRQISFGHPTSTLTCQDTDHLWIPGSQLPGLMFHVMFPYWKVRGSAVPGVAGLVETAFSFVWAVLVNQIVKSAHPNLADPAERGFSLYSESCLPQRNGDPSRVRVQQVAHQQQTQTTDNIDRGVSRACHMAPRHQGPAKQQASRGETTDRRANLNVPPRITHRLVDPLGAWHPPCQWDDQIQPDPQSAYQQVRSRE